MAKVRVAPEVLAQALFGYADTDVEIVRAAYDSLRHVIELEIRGPDVPDVAEVSAIYTEQRNRAGQRFITLKFEPLT